MNTYDKTYDNCPLKRAIQEALFPKKTDIILGLSSPRIESSYLKVLPEHKDLFLVNFEPKDDAINANSLIGLFDLLTYRNIIPTFIDADFCNTIINSGQDITYLFNKCKRFDKDIIISYTFAIRKVTLEETMNWLSSFGAHFDKRTEFRRDLWQHRQFAYQYGDAVFYRESGEHLLTGIIKLSKK